VIVLAHEDDRQRPQRRDVDRLIQLPLVGGAVAEDHKRRGVAVVGAAAAGGGGGGAAALAAARGVGAAVAAEACLSDADGDLSVGPGAGGGVAAGGRRVRRRVGATGAARRVGLRQRQARAQRRL